VFDPTDGDLSAGTKVCGGTGCNDHRNPQIKHSPALEIGDTGPSTKSIRRFARMPCRYRSRFFEGSVVFVVKQEILGAIVGNVDVVPAVAIKVAAVTPMVRPT